MTTFTGLDNFNMEGFLNDLRGSQTTDQDWADFDRLAFRRDVLTSFKQFADFYGPFLDKTKSVKANAEDVLEVKTAERLLGEADGLLTRLLSKDPTPHLFGGGGASMPMMGGGGSGNAGAMLGAFAGLLASLLSGGDGSEVPLPGGFPGEAGGGAAAGANDPFARYFPQGARIPSGQAPPDEFSGFQTALFDKVFPFVRKMLQEYLSLQRQRTFGLRPEPGTTNPARTWGMNLWNAPLKLHQQPTLAFLESVELYKECFGAPLDIAIHFFFWFLDSKQVRNKLSHDTEFIDMLCKLAVQNDRVQSLFRSHDWPQQRNRTKETEGLANFSQIMMMINLILCENGEPFREHTRQLQEAHPRLIDCLKVSPAHRIARTPTHFDTLLADRGRTDFMLVRVREETPTFITQAFDETGAIFIAGVDVQALPTDLLETARTAYQHDVQAQQPWITMVRERGSGIYGESCDVCGKHASVASEGGVGVEIFGCPGGCGKTRYCSDRCMEVSLEEGHGDECKGKGEMNDEEMEIAEAS